MRTTLWLSKTSAAVAALACAFVSLASPGFASGSPLACGSYKYCAKAGVIVRDHRTGAPHTGK